MNKKIKIALITLLVLCIGSFLLFQFSKYIFYANAPEIDLSDIEKYVNKQVILNEVYMQHTGMVPGGFNSPCKNEKRIGEIYDKTGEDILVHEACFAGIFSSTISCLKANVVADVKKTSHTGFYPGATATTEYYLDNVRILDCFEKENPFKINITLPEKTEFNKPFDLRVDIYNRWKTPLTNYTFCIDAYGAEITPSLIEIKELKPKTKVNYNFVVNVKNYINYDGNFDVEMYDNSLNESWTHHSWAWPPFVEKEYMEIGTSIPRFDDFSNDNKYEGEIAQPNFDTNQDAYAFRGQIKKDMEAGTNFARHYTISQWGCGTECSAGVVIDNKTGTIYPLPIAEFGRDFRKRSNLLIVNPLDVVHDTFEDWQTPEWVSTRYFKWENNQFELIHEIKY